jgi:hypothetical protein
LALWQSAAASLGPDCKAPEDVPRRVAELQREALRAAEQQGAAAMEERRLKVGSHLTSPPENQHIFNNGQNGHVVYVFIS